MKIRSDQISRSVVSSSLRPRESQHARPPCPSPTPGVHSNSCPLSQSCHPAISSSVVPFSSCPQSLPASESFPMSQLFAWGGQSTEVSDSETERSQLPMITSGSIKILTQECVVKNPVLNIAQLRLLSIWWRVNVIGLIMHRGCAGSKQEEIVKCVNHFICNKH